MRLTVNALSVKMGGAATYLQNVLPELVAQLDGSLASPIVVWGGGGLMAHNGSKGRLEFRASPASSSGGVHRLMFDQVQLPRMLRREHQDVLFSSASFGPLLCPCRQVLLVRNSAYFSKEYFSRMTSRSLRFKLRVQRWLTLRAIARSDHVLFPTQAMQHMVAAHTGGVRPNWSVAPYGARHDLFTPARPDAKQGSIIRLLHVSHYCDQKNIGTLLRALEKLQARSPGRYHLTLTADLNNLSEEETRHCPTLRVDRALMNQLAGQGVVTDLGSVPYGSLPDHYRQADIFVFPSYTESFGHPLVEAMACGLPVLAADEDVNREMCGDAGVYFPTFNAGVLADQIETVARDLTLRDELRARSLARAPGFDWKHHVSVLVKALG